MSKALTSHFRNYILLPAMALAGCSQHSDTPVRRGPPPTPPVVEAEKTPSRPSGCDIRLSQYNPQTMKAQAKPRTVNVERLLKRKIVKNCEGEVVFDGPVTIQDPTFDLELKAPGKRSFQSVFVLNDATCDHRLTAMPIWDLPLFGEAFNVTGNGHSRIEIKADMAQALLTFHMRGGQNDIYVHYFYDCSPHSISGNEHVIIGGGNCSESKDSLIVQYPIWVNYEERTVDGIIEDTPSIEKCEKEQQAQQQTLESSNAQN